MIQSGHELRPARPLPEYSCGLIPCVVLSLGAAMRRREFISLVGGAAAWPFAARAQQLAMPVIGFLRSTPLNSSTSLVAAFRQGLKESGFNEGQNVAVEFRFADSELRFESPQLLALRMKL